MWLDRESWSAIVSDARFTTRLTTVSLAFGVLPDRVSTFIKTLVQGGPLVGPATLLRFFMAHVVLLPAVMTALLYAHYRLSRRFGPAEPS